MPMLIFNCRTRLFLAIVQQRTILGGAPTLRLQVQPVNYALISHHAFQYIKLYILFIYSLLKKIFFELFFASFNFHFPSQHSFLLFLFAMYPNLVCCKQVLSLGWFSLFFLLNEKLFLSSCYVQWRTCRLHLVGSLPYPARQTKHKRH